MKEGQISQSQGDKFGESSLLVLQEQTVEDREGREGTLAIIHEREMVITDRNKSYAELSDSG